MASDRISEAGFDLDHVDRLLTTTRAVRKRLDFSRDVSDEVLFECIELAEQAPTGGNDASRRWIVVRDQDTKDKLGDLYRETGQFFDLAEQGGGSRLRFSMVIGKENNGTAPRALKNPDREEAVLNKRRETLKANMQATVDGVKAIVDRGSSR